MEEYQRYGNNKLFPDLEDIDPSFRFDDFDFEKYIGTIDSNNNYGLDLQTQHERLNYQEYNLDDSQIINNHHFESNPSSIGSASTTDMTEPSSVESVSMSEIAGLMSEPIDCLDVQKIEENNVTFDSDQSSVSTAESIILPEPSNYTAREESNPSSVISTSINDNIDLVNPELIHFVDSPIRSICEKSDPDDDIQLKRKRRREENNKASRVQRAKKKKMKEELEAEEAKLKEENIMLNTHVKVLEGQIQNELESIQSHMTHTLRNCTTEVRMIECLKNFVKKTLDCKEKLESSDGLYKRITSLLRECMEKELDHDKHRKLILQLLSQGIRRF